MVIDGWTGADAAALQRACHMSIEQFARQLRMSPRGVAEWHRRPTITLRQSTQQILDAELDRASAEVRTRFERYIGSRSPSGVPDPPATDTDSGTERQATIALANQGLADAFRAGLSTQNGSASVVAAANELLREYDDFLWDEDAPRSRLDCMEEAVEVHARDVLVVAPLDMTCRIGIDLAELRRLGQQSGTETEKVRAKRITARLALIMADEMSMLGEVNEARSWYSRAIAAADAIHDEALRADTRALAAMLPLYHGSPENVVMLTDQALALSTGKRCLASSLAAALNGLAWAKIGNAEHAVASLDIARSAHDEMNAPCHTESMFGFSTRRRLFYESRALTILRKYEDAQAVQEEALTLYPPHVVGDRALIVIDQAMALVATGAHEAGAELAAKTLAELPLQHRTRLFHDAANRVIDAIPRSSEKLPGVALGRETMRELIGTSSAQLG